MNQSFKFDWKNFKRYAALIASVLLLFVSGVGFTTGISFGSEWGQVVALCIWIAVTIIQLTGTDMENHVSWAFSLGWAFSYLLGIGASSWAMYQWILIDNDVIRWSVAVGLGGVTEILPEQMIVIFFKSLPKEIMRAATGHADRPQRPAVEQSRPSQQNTPYRPAQQSLSRPQMPPAPAASYKPLHRPDNKWKDEPTYKNLQRNIGPDEDRLG